MPAKSTRKGIRKDVRPAVLAYLQEHAGEVVYLAKAREDLPHLHPVSVAGALRSLAIQVPQHVEKLAWGTYRYHAAARPGVGDGAAQPEPKGRDMLLTHVSDSVDGGGETVALMRDDESGELFVVKPFTFKF